MFRLIRNRNVLLVSLGFFFVFFGFSGVQQYLVPVFNLEGNADIALTSLFLIYIFFTLSGFITPTLISRLGLRKTLILASLTYVTFSLVAIFRDVNVFYLFSILLGIAAPMLWTSGGTYVIRSVNIKMQGESLGFQNSMYMFGAFAGVFLASILLNLISFDVTYIIMASTILIGTILFTLLKEVKIRVKRVPISKTFGMILDKRLLLLMPTVFSSYFIMGMFISAIPLSIQKSFGFFSLTLAIFIIGFIRVLGSYLLGKLSDKYSKKKILYFSAVASLLGIFFFVVSFNIYTLIFSVVLIGLYTAVAYPLILSILGKTYRKENLESSIALFQVFSSIGVTFAILFTLFFTEIVVFEILSGVVIFSLLSLMIYSREFSTKDL